LPQSVNVIHDPCGIPGADEGAARLKGFPVEFHANGEGVLADPLPVTAPGRAESPLKRTQNRSGSLAGVSAQADGRPAALTPDISTRRISLPAGFTVHVTRTATVLAAARERGRVGGRRETYTDAQIEAAAELVRQDASIVEARMNVKDRRAGRSRRQVEGQDLGTESRT
jgi:hypothetical protein